VHKIPRRIRPRMFLKKPILLPPPQGCTPQPTLARATHQPAMPLARKRPVSAPLAPGMEFKPTPELCAVLRGVRVGGVRTLTTCCLRGGECDSQEGLR